MNNGRLMHSLTARIKLVGIIDRKCVSRNARYEKGWSDSAYRSALLNLYIVSTCRGRFPRYFNVFYGNQRFNFFSEGIKALCAEGLAFAFGILGLGGGIERMPNVYASEA